LSILSAARSAVPSPPSAARSAVPSPPSAARSAVPSPPSPARSTVPSPRSAARSAVPSPRSAARSRFRAALSSSDEATDEESDGDYQPPQRTLLSTFSRAASPMIRRQRGSVRRFIGRGY
jgi:hypothetical protein